MRLFQLLFWANCWLLVCCFGAIADPILHPMTFNEYRRAMNQIDYEKHQVNPTEFKELCSKPNVYILDLRSRQAYEKGHIKGALYLGADITEERLQQLVPDKQATILIYCQNTIGIPSRRVSLTDVCLPQIIILGYPNTFILKRPLGLPPGSTDNQYYESTFGSLWEAGAGNDVNTQSHH